MLMNRDERKKILFVVGMEHKLENFIQQKMKINPENMVYIYYNRLEDLEPFGNVMRNTIAAVYMENVEEIYLVSTNNDQKNEGSSLNKILRKIGPQAEMQTLDYLFKNCMPEFPGKNISDWIEGSRTLADDIQNSMNVIRNHPLMPSDIKVSELLIEKIDSEPAETTVEHF